MTFYTSDLHLGHENIIKLCGRPFAHVAQMNEKLIENWNRKVKKLDTVYILGDLFWNKATARELLPRLAGKKILLVGNHDESWVKDKELRAGFAEVELMITRNLNCHPLTLCHYPLLEWHASRKDGSRKLGYLVHGHIHNAMRPEYRFLFRKFNTLNAGVDINGFAPVTFEEMVENNLNYKLSRLTDEADIAYLKAQMSE